MAMAKATKNTRARDGKGRKPASRSMNNESSKIKRAAQTAARELLAEAGRRLGVA